jgi:hypothetical protein
MARPATHLSVLLLSAALASAACNSAKDSPKLSKPAAEEKIPGVPVPPADGPKLGAIADVTPVLERPSPGAQQLGYLHAGALVARAAEPFGKDGCDGGWYPVRPRGFVCAAGAATTDLSHPTLKAMAMAPKLDQPLPYAYARTRGEATLYERDAGRPDAVREAGRLRPRSSLAVVGSWSALDPEGKPSRFALMTNGRFVKAEELVAGEPSGFRGVELGKDRELPLAFVVKRGVRAWKVEGQEADKLDHFSYHQILPLTGRFREVSSLRYWALADGRYARHRDVTVVRKRNSFPDFATEGQKWIDVSVVTGTLIAYEGKQPIYVTLVSVGRDRMGDPKTTASTAMGTFRVTGKHVTAAAYDPKALADYVDVYDAPWALELSSGQLVHGAPWHDRFGIEHGLGSIQLAPADAAWLWAWSDPSLPEAWHGVSQPAEGKTATLVLVRK